MSAENGDSSIIISPFQIQPVPRIPNTRFTHAGSASSPYKKKLKRTVKVEIFIESPTKRMHLHFNYAHHLQMTQNAHIVPVYIQMHRVKKGKGARLVLNGQMNDVVKINHKNFMHCLL